MKKYVKVCLILACIFTAVGLTMMSTVYFVYYDDRYDQKADIDYTFEGVVDGVDFDSAYGNVTVTRGDEFTVSVKNVNPDECHVSLDNAILKVKLDAPDETEVLGWKLSPYENFVTCKKSDISITVPTNLSLMYCDLGCGSLKVDNIGIGRMINQVGIGYVEYNNVTTHIENYLQLVLGVKKSNGAKKLALNQIDSLEDNVF